jgi:hypothetical protein
MKLRDFRKQLRDWPPLLAVDLASGESESYESVVDASGRVVRVRKLPWPTSLDDRERASDKAFGGDRLVATDTDERAGWNEVPGEDCSAVPVCPRPDERKAFTIHRGCKATNLGRSLGTLFARYYRHVASPDPVLKAVFWETYDWAVHMMDPHASARLVRLEENPTPPEYETVTDLRALRLCCSAVHGAEERLSVFNLYPVEVDACSCESPWDGIRADCATCHGLGVVWRLRLHPVVLPERGAPEALARTAARLGR